MKRIAIVVAAIILVVVAGAAVGFHFAVRMLKDKVVAALGPGSELRGLKVGWSSIELSGLVIKGPKGLAGGENARGRSRDDRPEPQKPL